MLKQKKVFNCSYLDEISLSGLFLKSKVPLNQKSLAANYIAIRKIFSYSIVQPKVSNVEYSKLKNNGFLPLELTDEKRMYNELMKILDWNDSTSAVLQKLADTIFEIRTKELKYLLANTPNAKLNELMQGYKILIKYLEFIAG